MLDKSDWPIFAGFGTCAVGGLFIYCYRHASLYLKVLQKLEEHEVDNDLYAKVKSAGGTLPYVAINGNVSADDKVIQGVDNTEMEGVIRNVKITEHKSKWNSTSKDWYSTKRIISSTWKVESFSLVGGNERSRDIKINVKNPCSASSLHLSKISDKYEPAELSAGDFVIDYVVGEYVQGIQTVEKMLLVSSPITIIGEVKISPGGQLIITASSNDSLGYYITNNGLSGVISDEKSTMQSWKVLAIIFFFIGGGLCTYWLFKCYQKYLAQNQYMQSVEEMERFNANIEGGDDRICSICLGELRNVVFLPCGHICACSKCSNKMNKCPVCRGCIQSRSIVFYS